MPAFDRVASRVEPQRAASNRPLAAGCKTEWQRAFRGQRQRTDVTNGFPDGHSAEPAAVALAAWPAMSGLIGDVHQLNGLP